MEKKLRIAFLTSHPIQYQAPFFQLLAKYDGIDLTVYFAWDFGVNKKSLDKEFGAMVQWDVPLLEGYHYIFLKNSSPRPSSAFWGQVNFGIIREIAKRRYDALVVYGWNGFTNWLAFFSCIFTRTPFFMRGESAMNQEKTFGTKAAIKKVVLSWLFRRAAGFFYIGEENKLFYKHFGVPDRKLFFTPYAVDNTRFMEEASTFYGKKSELKRALGIEANDMVILFMGKLIPKKRPMDLLRAYESVKNQKKALVFVGDGALRGELQGYVKENRVPNVHFVGFKNQKELGKYYAMADAFVLPSGVGETWGLAVNEAMCFSLPVLVSDKVGCAKDLVKNGENGFQIPLGDWKTLGEKLSILAGGEGLRTSFGTRSFALVQKYGFQDDVRGFIEGFSKTKK